MAKKDVCDVLALRATNKLTLGIIWKTHDFKGYTEFRSKNQE